MDNCFWCGEPVGRQHATMEIGGVPKPFHTNLLKDCANEYNKWKTDQQLAPYMPRLQLVEGR